MLSVDLTALDREIADGVTRACAEFGTVEHVSVHIPPRGTCFAIVTMKNRRAIAALVHRLGARALGTSAYLPLGQSSAHTLH